MNDLVQGCSLIDILDIDDGLVFKPIEEEPMPDSVELYGHVLTELTQGIAELKSAIGGVFATLKGFEKRMDSRLTELAAEAISRDVFEKHSGTTNDANVYNIGSSTKYENVQFSDQHDPYMYDLDDTVDPTRQLQDMDDATLEHFFSRPLKISEQEWGTGTNLAFQIDPWSLYWNNPRVSNRIANFHLLRCNLMVKIVINGNGFQYGRALAAYLPYESQDFLSTNASLVQNDLVGTSQLPHVFLDPTMSTGGEMKLPMFNYLNYISIPDAQWSELGILFFRSLNDLKHANGATDKVTISTFAWATDVKMSVLTSVEPSTIGPQDGDEVEEFEPHSGEVEEANKEGMISGPATTVSKWASYLTKVPYIGPFATATQIAAGATASIAKMFGYCRPPVTKNPEPFRPTAISSLAVTNVPDTAHKLTVDHQQELSIDPRISGLGGVDAMNIREIAKRESYLTKFTWAINAAPETLLWNARVDPVTWAQTPGPPDSFHFPACAMAALPFQYWTGTMRFRFQVVCSSFHKGRIKIVYDPNYLATNEYNTNYLRIVDIAEEQDFTIEVGNGQELTLLDHHYPGTDSVTQMYSSTPYASKEAGNGVIGVYIVNELTTPNSVVNNDIEVNVFVSMGDDFEVFVPEAYFQNFVVKPLTPQSGEEIENFEPHSGEVKVPDAQNTSEPSAPQQSEATIVGMGGTQHPDINKVFTGEAITSFRTMLKRYNLWSSIGNLDSFDVAISGRRSLFPYYRGEVPGAVDLTAIATGYNYCNTVLLHWVKSAFSGFRGSVRYKIVPRGNDSFQDRVEVQRSKLDPTLIQFRDGLITLPSYTTNKGVRRSVVTGTPANGTVNLNQTLGGAEGKSLTYHHINHALEFEVPWYSKYRFEPGKRVNWTDISNKYTPCWDFYIESGGGQQGVHDVYVAAAEDFQVYFFTGLPRMYYEVGAPA